MTVTPDPAPQSPEGTADEATEIAARLREAREYLGFTIIDAARRIGINPVFLRQLEDGEADAPEPLLAAIGKFYMRPVEWFRGEFKFEPSRFLICGTEDLTDGDREAVLDFAEFLQCKKAAEND